MPLRPIAIVIALLALSGAVWLLVAAVRHRRRWTSVFRVAPALCLLGLVAVLVPYIFGLSGPRPFFNRAAPVPAATVVYRVVSRYSSTPPSGSLIAFQGQTGKVLWQRTIPGNQWYFTVGDDAVFVVASANSSTPGGAVTPTVEILAFSAATGAVRWHETLPPDLIVQGPAVLAHGVLFLGAGQSDSHAPGQILALRPSDGSRVWTAQIAPLDANTDTPTLYATDDVLFVRLGLFVLQARSLTDGRLLWTNPQVGHNVVFGSDAIYELQNYGSLIARSAQTGDTLWQFGDLDMFHAGYVAGDTLYVTAQRSGTAPAATDAKGRLTNPETLYALDASTGRVRWRFVTQSAGAGYVVAGRDTVYIQADDGVHALRAADGTVRWHSDSHNNWTIDAPFIPVVVGPVLYVGAAQALPPEILTVFPPRKVQDYLYAVNEADGSADWGVAVGPVTTISPHLGM